MGGRPLVVETLQAMLKNDDPGNDPPAALAAELAAARACAGASCP